MFYSWGKNYEANYVFEIQIRLLIELSLKAELSNLAPIGNNLNANFSKKS